MKSPSRAGALARTASTGSDGRTTSSRRMFSSSIVWAVGGMSSVGSSARIAYWSRMWLSWPSSRASSSSVRPEAREVGDVLDVGAGQGGHAPDDSRRVGYDRSMQLPSIRPMTAADVDQIVAALLREDWGDRRPNLDFAVAHPETHPFVADADGVVVGTGLVTVHGRSAWIGTVWVTPAWRSKGLGRALTQATIDAAEAAGARTVVLVATDVGLPLYEKLGFEVQTWYRMMGCAGSRWRGAGPGRPALRAARPRSDDGARCRSHGRGPAPPASRPSRARRPGWVLARDDGTLGGFVVRAPWGGGATIAPRIEDAMTILRARRVMAGARDRSGRGCWPRTRPGSRTSQRAAGSRPGARRDSSAASRSTGSRRPSGGSSTSPWDSGQDPMAQRACLASAEGGMASAVAGPHPPRTWTTAELPPPGASLHHVAFPRPRTPAPERHGQRAWPRSG